MALTYFGATVASTDQNPPMVIAQTMVGSVPNSVALTGGKVWFYSSTNTVAELNAANAFDDGYELGMRSGDLLFGVFSTAASLLPLPYMAAVIGTTAGASLSTSPEA